MQISAGTDHTVLLCSDGSARCIGRNSFSKCDLPVLMEGLEYVQISAGRNHTVALRSDGSVIAVGSNQDGQCSIPDLPIGLLYMQVSAGTYHTVLLRSDGIAIATMQRNFEVYEPEESEKFVQISAGGEFTALLQSDGRVAAVPSPCSSRRCYKLDLSSLEADVGYVQASAGESHLVLLRGDGQVVAVGRDNCGQCNLPPDEVFAGDRVQHDRSQARVFLQLLLSSEDLERCLIRSYSLNGAENKSLIVDSKMRMPGVLWLLANAGRMQPDRLEFVLPDGRLLRQCESTATLDELMA